MNVYPNVHSGCTQQLVDNENETRRGESMTNDVGRTCIMNANLIKALLRSVACRLLTIDHFLL